MHICRYHLRCLRIDDIITSPLDLGPLNSSVAAIREYIDIATGLLDAECVGKSELREPYFYAPASKH